MEFKCRRGKWSKKNRINCDFEGTPCEFKVQLNSRTVTYHVEKKETVLFNQYFKEGSHLQFRCMNIGSERLKGKNEIVCSAGTWSHALPFCVPLDPLNRNKDSPPILFDVVGGPYSISPTGELIVGRSATVSFSCIFPRKMGKVRWEVSSTYRSYSQIWTLLNALGIDKTDAYQLTVAVAQPEDSGILHCIIPSGKRHTIKMQVDGTVAQFSCPSGYRIHGYTTSTCQADGTWTHPPPKCYAMQCPPIAVDGKVMSVSISSFKFGGIAQFQCVKGFTLLGAEHIHCTSEGIWSDKIPSCSVVKCGKVIPPKNGFLVGSTHDYYQKGDIVLFGCLTNHILTGGDFVICQANGKWSEMLTKCDPYCRHPGRPSHGDSTAPAKDYYLIGEKIVFYCPSPEYKLNSENVLSCIGAGKWSRKVPLCLLANRN